MPIKEGEKDGKKHIYLDPATLMVIMLDLSIHRREIALMPKVFETEQQLQTFWNSFCDLLADEIDALIYAKGKKPDDYDDDDDDEKKEGDRRPGKA